MEFMANQSNNCAKVRLGTKWVFIRITNRIMGKRLHTGARKPRKQLHHWKANRIQGMTHKIWNPRALYIACGQLHISKKSPLGSLAVWQASLLIQQFFFLLILKTGERGLLESHKFQFPRTCWDDPLNLSSFLPPSSREYFNLEETATQHSFFLRESWATCRDIFYLSQWFSDGVNHIWIGTENTQVVFGTFLHNKRFSHKTLKDLDGCSNGYKTWLYWPESRV